jgi:alkaline phosphatase D
MNLTRRQFLKLTARTGAAFPFLLNPYGCAPLLTGDDADTGISLGCVAGDVTSDGAVIWLRADSGGIASLEYGKDPALKRQSTATRVAVEPDRDNTARVILEGLEPATVYYYRASMERKKPGPIGRLVTAPTPDDNAVVRFCFSGDTRENYQPFTIMHSMRLRNPDFFIHLGDTIYADRGGTAQALPEFWAKYRGNRADLWSQSLFAHTSAYVIWDDHEVVDNYEGNHPLAAVGRRAFFDYWPVRRNEAEPDRLYRSFRWGKALELFLLDGRQYRDYAGGTLLGKSQKQWLFEGIAASSALFKCVACSVPLYGGGRDRWDGYPRERVELLRWIRARRIKGVFFLGADLHYAAVTRIAGVAKVKEIITGPMAAPLNVLATGNSRRFEFFSNRHFNYGMITIDPTSSKPQASVEILDESNISLFKTVIDGT